MAFTTTKVPRFDGTTSWEQYKQVFDAIVSSNGWDNDTAALQLFSHLEGDALNVSLLVPLSRQLSRTDLVGALSAHYESLGRLADYRRQFEKTTRTAGEYPSIFATALETLAMNAFGDLGQTAHLWFIAGHSSCELRRHLDSVPPETPIRDVVGRCRVWESHADPAVHRVCKPSPDPIYPAYVVGDSDSISETTRVAAVTRPRSGSARGLTPTVADGRRYPGSHTVAGRRSSGVGGIGIDDTVVPLWTATDAAAPSTTTHLTGLERCGVFLMWEVGSCGDSMPRLE